MRAEINQEFHFWFQTARDEKTQMLWATIMTNDLSDWDDKKFIQLIELAKAAFKAGYARGALTGDDDAYPV